MTVALLDCIGSVCEESVTTRKVLSNIQLGADALSQDMIDSGDAIKCVVNGPEGGSCNLPEGGTLPTLAEALAQLNACQIANVSGENFIAIEGQTVFTLASAPINAFAVEVSMNGSICEPTTDFTTVGTTLTFTDPIPAGYAITTRTFAP